MGGALTAATGGAIAASAGLSVSTVAGGALTGASGAAFGGPVQGIGNAAYFGDAYGPGQFLTDIVVGGVLGGVAGGVSGWLKNVKNVRNGGQPGDIWGFRTAGKGQGVDPSKLGQAFPENGQAVFPDGVDPLTGQSFKGGTYDVSFPSGMEYLDEGLRMTEQPFAGAARGGIQLTKKLFGHTFTTHGDDMTNFLLNRAKGSGMAQGQFLNNQKAAQFILDNAGKTANGAVNIPIPKGFPARIIMPDGTFRPATHIRLIPGGSGVKTAYPLIP